ncbi:FabD/lysophospholipase-like protein [Tothia fuscella]|uniref:FabD/lysophospholipase-like protein n=1 Tax=Tothia fuscella TaxID=1048955 RepID=A0A9P4NL76_9PEZI|nr:FabD/lysophospholipase-like protein [Tothia fuscella]
MNNSALRRKDTTKGPPLRILSLDGGGVRGYSMLIILQELMHRTFVENEGRAPKRNSTEIPKPCDHFDLIVGTGTGGLIALMLGRLRLDIETCKDVYVRMTKRVFETDKTIAGIPYRSTLFKASKLEEAIQECVRQHTIYESEGNDQGDEPDMPESPQYSNQHNLDLPMTPGSAYPSGRVNRSPSVASRYSQIGTGATPVSDFRSSRWGKPNALLYDSRENRTKTAVTAVYKGTSRGGKPALLRSYDSRKETAVEERCTIWQAGRATAATALAFKPIKIGQSVFLDEGAGKYNPTPTALDEAVINEWPGREVGVLISIGTGKRPNGTNAQQHMWWEGFVSSGMGDFAEARRKLIAKIEGCEETHRLVEQKILFDRGVNPENYYRLNVEVGVGEFGMNEWNRLSDISTNTRRYLAQDDVQRQNIDAAAKLSRIHRANQRWSRATHGLPEDNRMSWEISSQVGPEPPSVPGAVELPAEEVPYERPQSQWLSPQSYQGPAEDDKFLVTADDPYTYEPRRSGEMGPPIQSPYRRSHESSRRSGEYAPGMNGEGGRLPHTPPPLPPKTPIPFAGAGAPPPPPRQPGAVPLPYPDTDGPPPIVNIARKPELR